MGYSYPFEAHVSYVKDAWCQPSCMCLHQAVSSGDLGRVRASPAHTHTTRNSLVVSHATQVNAAIQGLVPFTRKHSINQLDEVGRSPAMVAAWRGEKAILKWLISKG